MGTADSRDGPEDVIQFERELLTDMFENLNRKYGDVIGKYRTDLLPSMLAVACWEFDACLEMLRAEFGRTDLEDDLDPEAERQLCERARRETGIPAVFVLGFPLAARPFYTAPRGSRGAASSFDLLFQGLEITTGGQRLHLRQAMPLVCHVQAGIAEGKVLPTALAVEPGCVYINGSNPLRPAASYRFVFK
jgi:nondiscriminating aspartyl-tRNA synthetase